MQRYWCSKKRPITLQKQHTLVHMTSACARTWLCTQARVQADTRAPIRICCHHKTSKTAALQHGLAASLEAGEGCGRIPLNLPAPTALLWFNFVAKASPRQAPAHHVMMYCASNNPERSCGLPKERHQQCHIPNTTGEGVCNWFRRSLGLIHCSLAFFDWQHWRGLK